VKTVKGRKSKLAIYSREGASKLYDDYLALAHELCKGMVHVPCGMFGGPDHHPLEEKIAKACVAAFHRGKSAGGRR
jgi:hypothetical protein